MIDLGTSALPPWIDSKTFELGFVWQLLPDKGPEIELPDWSSISPFSLQSFPLPPFPFNLHCMAEVENKAHEDDAEDVDREGDHPEVDVAVENAHHLKEDDESHEWKDLSWAEFSCFLVLFQTL